tara:strand:- start:126 stop:635 length:510 start_codon:yes stop_codon:yes gene_type:complete
MTCPGCGVTLTPGLPCSCNSSSNIPIRIDIPSDTIHRLINGEPLPGAYQFLRPEDMQIFNSSLYNIRYISNILSENSDLIESNEELPIDVKFRIQNNAYQEILKYKTKECKGGECLFCTETYSKENGVIMPCCNKEIHKNCFKEWVFKKSPTCPLCRHKFKKEIQENTL